MSRHSKKRIVEILTPPADDTLLGRDENNDPLVLLERKIALTEGFTTQKFCELILRDRIGYRRKMH